MPLGFFGIKPPRWGRRAIEPEHSAMDFMESRLPPLPRAFLTFSEESSPVQSTLRRSRSYSGYTPFELSDASCELDSDPCAGLAELCPPDTDDEETVQWVGLRLPSSAGGGGVSDAHPQTSATTMMINRLPRLMTQHDLMEQLNRFGFQHFYDFCYVPYTFDCKQHKGYAFVNFVNPVIAHVFQSSWHKRVLTTSAGDSGKVVIGPSGVQGLQANVRKWCGPRTQHIRNPNLQPFVLSKAMSATSSKQVMKAQRAGAVALRKARAMMPDVSPEWLSSHRSTSMQP